MTGQKTGITKEYEKMKEIPLTQGKHALVDDEDYEWLSKHKWYYSGDGYAHRHPPRDGKPLKTERMHVSIIGKIDGLEVDHIDGNGLNNQRNNLRHVTKSQNQHNGKSHENSSSKYKGVSLHSQVHRWWARITADGKVKSLGCYNSEAEAAKVYNEAAKKYYGEYARLNIIEEDVE